MLTTYDLEIPLKEKTTNMNEISFMKEPQQHYL